MLAVREQDRQRGLRRQLDCHDRCGSSSTMAAPMRRVLLTLLLVWPALLAQPSTLHAQEPPPPIPRLALDLRGSVPRFPRDSQLADSRGMLLAELPGRGWGGDIGLHVYLFKVKAMTVGLGGQLTLARATVAPQGDANTPVVRGAIERFQAITPQLSFNFGDGDGWSYISGGIGPSQRTLVPDGGAISEIDEERLRSVNYGGGARWFIKPHLAFTFDVRFHDIDPGTSFFGRPGSPRTRLLIIGAGLSVK